MKGKPILVAVASFVIVLLGGAAFAGVGTQWSDDSETTVTAAHAASAPVTIDVPEWLTTTTSTEKKPEFVEAAMYVADDIEWALVVAPVRPQALALDFRLGDLLG